MPELPDIAAYLDALGPRILGRRLLAARLGSPFVLRTAVPPLSEIEQREVTDLRRVGKRVALRFDNGLWVVIHLMIAGRLHWKPAPAKLGSRNALAAFDFETGSLLLTEAGTKRRASIHVVRGEAGLESLDPGGLEVLGSSLENFRAAMTAENRTLKRALTDPRIMSGIGNAYSDEILHAAELSPILLTHKLTTQEWQRLHAATLATLTAWVERLGAEARVKFPDKVTAFRPEMAVHGRFGKPCPRCGAPVQRIRYADRALSRLLGSDWPRSLDELEALKRR